MFTVYNNGIPDFKSTSENIYNVKSIEQVNKTSLETQSEAFKDFSRQEQQEQRKKKNTEFLNSYQKISQIDSVQTAYFVKDIMTQDVIYMDNSHTVKEAHALLNDRKIAQIPITTIDKKIIGLVDSRFILNLLVQNLDNPQGVFNRKLQDVSFPEIITTHPDTDLKEVIKIMLDFRLGALAVVNEEGELKGIVSKSYIFKSMTCSPQLEMWT